MNATPWEIRGRLATKRDSRWNPKALLKWGGLAGQPSAWGNIESSQVRGMLGGSTIRFRPDELDEAECPEVVEALLARIQLQTRLGFATGGEGQESGICSGSTRQGGSSLTLSRDLRQASRAERIKGARRANNAGNVIAWGPHAHLTRHQVVWEVGLHHGCTL